MLAVMLEQERAAGKSAPVYSALRSSLLDLLRQARSAFDPRYREAIPSWRHHVFSELYLAESDPPKDWRADFGKFAAERRASMHYTYGDRHSQASPSLFLAGVALGAMQRCASLEEGSALRQHAFPLWEEVFEATHLHFTHPSLADEHWRKVAAGLFARYPECLDARGASRVQPDGIQWLKQLGKDEALFATAVANLLANGLQIGSIAGPENDQEELKKRIRDYLAWEGGAGSRNLYPGVVAILSKNM